jgi:hypothetical protein
MHSLSGKTRATEGQTESRLLSGMGGAGNPRTTWTYDPNAAALTVREIVSQGEGAEDA